MSPFLTFACRRCHLNPVKIGGIDLTIVVLPDDTFQTVRVGFSPLNDEYLQWSGRATRPATPRLVDGP